MRFYLRETGERTVPEVTIVYWRDIPAQVIVGKGRRSIKRPLSERFEKAIDMAAMRSGASDSEAYLADWRRADPYEVEGEAETVADAEAARLEQAFDGNRMRSLVSNGGRD